MRVTKKPLFWAACLFFGLGSGAWGWAEEVFPKQFQLQLSEGDLAEARRIVDESKRETPGDPQVQFASGVLGLLEGLEGLAQDQYRHGVFSGNARNIPLFRLPVPENQKPQEVTYLQVRETIQRFQDKLQFAIAELEKVNLEKEVKLPLDLATIRLDLNGDGTAVADESFPSVLGAVTRVTPVQNQEFKITFDNGDVPWLQGYCHFLSGMCDLYLAYDHQELFDACGHLVYPQHVPSKQVIKMYHSTETFSETWFLDLIAAIHLIDFPLKDAARMESARQHFLEMIRTSRTSWKLILAETDNDHEWLPSPKQTGVLRIPVTREMVESWQGVLTEMEDLLEGRKLVPFWRDYVRIFNPPVKISTRGRGFNLKKFFQEPSQFDLVLMIQGSAATPYLEDGALSTADTWNRLSSVFGGQFFGFAVWFN